MKESYTELNWTGETNGIRINIIGVGVKPASKFCAHPNNPKFHPESQQKALNASLGKHGNSGFVIENKQTGYVLDGHERVWNAFQKGEDTLLPYYVIDIPEEQEDEFLLGFDMVGFMSNWDYSKLDEMRDRGVFEEMEFFNVAALEDELDRRNFTEEEIEINPAPREIPSADEEWMMFFKFSNKDEFLRAHKKIFGYEFDGEGNSAVGTGNLLD